MTDWSQIVTQHGPAVWQTVYRLVSHDADAADCFQNVFVAAVQLSRKQAVDNWPALLKRLAIARSLDCLRQRYRPADRRTVSLDAPAVDYRAPDPAGTIENRELLQQLRKALVELDERQAQVFYLAAIDRLPYRRIAEQMGITVNHVGVLLNRARSELKDRLRAFQPGADIAPLKRERPS